MIKFSFFLFLLFVSISVIGQDNPDKRNQYYALNTFFIEGLGKTGNVSLNFERRYILDEKKAISGQIGVGPDVGALKVPLTFNYIQSKGPHHLVMGLGQTMFFNAELNSGKFIYHKLTYSLEDSYWHVQIGYRYQPIAGGLFAQVLYTPLFGSPDAPGPEIIGVHQWVGISIGYSLKNVNVQ
jgi:hypothetical protein